MFSAMRKSRRNCVCVRTWSCVALRMWWRRNMALGIDQPLPPFKFDEILYSTHLKCSHYAQHLYSFGIATYASLAIYFKSVKRFKEKIQLVLPLFPQTISFRKINSVFFCFSRQAPRRKCSDFKNYFYR